MKNINKDFNIAIPDFSKKFQEAINKTLNANIELFRKNINSNFENIKNSIKTLSDVATELTNNFDPTNKIETILLFDNLLHQVAPTLKFMYNEYPEYKNVEIISEDDDSELINVLNNAEAYCNTNNICIEQDTNYTLRKSKDNKITIETTIALITLLVTIFLGIWDHYDKNNNNIYNSEIIINNNETEEILSNLAETIYIELTDINNTINELNRQSIEESDLVNNKMSKEDILKLAKEKGIKLSYLNDLIGGYRGKLTDWKNGKTTLTENEIQVITDYLLGNKPIDKQLEDIDFALLSETEELTESQKEDVLKYIRFLKTDSKE